MALNGTRDEALVYAVIESHGHHSPGSLVSRFKIPSFDPVADPQAIVQRDGRRLVLYAARGFDATPNAVVVAILDRDRSAVVLRRDRFVSPGQPGRDGGVHADLRTLWMYGIEEVAEGTVTIRTVEGQLVRVDLTTGAPMPIPDPGIVAQAGVNIPHGQCGLGLRGPATGPPVCPDTLQPPVSARGIPEFGICHYEPATIVSDTSTQSEAHSSERNVTLVMFGSEYRLRLNIRSEGKDNRPTDIAWSIAHPNVWVRARLNPGAAKLISGKLEGAPNTKVTGVGDRAGLLSLEIATLNETIYVVRRSVFFPGEKGAMDLLAYRSSDLVVSGPIE